MFMFLVENNIMTLQEIFDNCVADVNGDRTRGTQRFLIAAKKEIPTVTIAECMDVAGFTSDDEKKALNLAQSFRTNIFNPLRDHLAKIKFGVDNPEKIFGRTGVEKTKEDMDLRQNILNLLPARTRAKGAGRVATTKNMDHLADLV